MPNTKVAIKALRQSERRREINLAKKKTLKGIIKDYKKTKETNQEEAKDKLKTVYKNLDKAAKINLIHKNKASRLKSRLAKEKNKVVK